MDRIDEVNLMDSIIGKYNPIGKIYRSKDGVSWLESGVAYSTTISSKDFMDTIEYISRELKGKNK